jgi:hypothetical protein
MEKEILQVMTKFYVESLNYYGRAVAVAKLGLRLDHYGQIL